MKDKQSQSQRLLKILNHYGIYADYTVNHHKYFAQHFLSLYYVSSSGEEINVKFTGHNIAFKGAVFVRNLRKVYNLK